MAHKVIVILYCNEEDKWKHYEVNIENASTFEPTDTDDYDYKTIHSEFHDDT